MVTRMDRDIGRLLQLLRDLHLDKNTLVVFTSDNGPINAGGADPDFFQNAGGLRGWKFSLYEGGIRVPFIASWPGTIPASSVSDAPISHDDLFPTFCDMAQITSPEVLDGVSQLMTWKGKGPSRHKERYYWESPSKDGLMQAIRKGNLKGIRPKANVGFELYDLSTDPSESNNLAMQYPEQADLLEKEMQSLRTELSR